MKPYLDPAYQTHEEDRAAVYFDAHLRILLRAVGPAARILEVGAGPGLFAEVATARGFDITAIEPGARYPDCAGRLGSRAKHRTWQEQFACDDESFDAIVAWEVLEHLPDPLAFSRAALARLKPNGALVMSTPNARSWSVRVLRDADPMLCPDEHLHLFSRAGLIAILRNAGAAEVRLEGFGYLLPNEIERSAKRLKFQPPKFASQVASGITRCIGRTRISLGTVVIARPSRR